MKPPPRTRTRSKRVLKPDSAAELPRKVAWQRAEKRKLLRALKTLDGTVAVQRDVDCAALRKSVPTRSVSEIHAMVEALKDQVISCASLRLGKKRWEERTTRKPIEMWTHVASAVSGALEEPISTAFSQMLNVASTEPCTLRNCDPPQVHRPPTDKDKLVGRTIPLRPIPHLPVKVEPSGISTGNPLQTFKTPAPTKGPAKKPPSQVVRVSNCKTSSPQQKQCSEQLLTSISTAFASTSSPPSPHKPLCSSAASLSPLPSTAPSSDTSSCSPTCPTLSPPPVEFHGRFDQTSKTNTKDTKRLLTFGVRSVVDFERIYRYLSMIHKPNDDCHLTPMESAIVLDLLMSLPEELSLLECSKLHKHFVQVYKCLSSPANSSMAREMFKDLKHGFCAQTMGGSSRAPTHQHPAGTAHSTAVLDSEGKKPHLEEREGQSSGSSNTSSQSGGADVAGLCPPLNPFMVPLKLLKRR